MAFVVDVDTLQVAASTLCLMAAVLLQALGLMSGAYHLPPGDPARMRATVPPVVSCLAGLALFPWASLG